MCDCDCSARIDAIEAQLAAVNKAALAVLPNVEASAARLRQHMTDMDARIADIDPRVERLRVRSCPET